MFQLREMSEKEITGATWLHTVTVFEKRLARAAQADALRQVVEAIKLPCPYDGLTPKWQCPRCLNELLLLNSDTQSALDKMSKPTPKE